PPPRSTLFPYTTLFRSEARRRHLAAWPDAVEAAVTALDRVAAPVAEALLPAAQGLTADLEPPEGRPGDPVVERALAAHKRLVAQDRKSTRLNSSHVEIS